MSLKSLREQMEKQADEDALRSDFVTMGFIDEIQKIAAKKCPGSKILSKGKGRGLGIGQGKGPLGVPIEEKLQRGDLDYKDIAEAARKEGAACPGSKLRSGGKGRGLGIGGGKGPRGIPVGEKTAAKWMQKAVNPKEKGELHKKMGVPPDQKIPTGDLQAKLRGLIADGKAGFETADQIRFALTARGASIPKKKK